MSIECRDDEVIRFARHARLPEPPPAAGPTAADLLNSPEIIGLLAEMRRSAPALTRILIRLEQLECTGALANLMELVDVFAALKASMSDAMVHRMGESMRRGLETMDAVMQSGLPEHLPALAAAADRARAEAAKDTHFVSPLEVLAAPRQPEMQWVMRFMLALAREMRGVFADPPSPGPPASA